MADEQHRDRADHDKTPRPDHQPAAPGGGVGDLIAPDALPLSVDPVALLDDPRLNGRGNTPVRQAALQRMQQTQGNRAVQRALRLQRATSPAPPAVIQRETPSAAPAPAGTGAGATSADPTAASGDLIVDDATADLQPGQMKKGAFLTQLRTAVNSTVEQVL